MGFQVAFSGLSGVSYTYWNIDNLTGAGIQAVPGNYCFGKRLANGNILPLYFGIAEDLRTRIFVGEKPL